MGVKELLVAGNAMASSAGVPALARRQKVCAFCWESGFAKFAGRRNSVHDCYDPSTLCGPIGLVFVGCVLAGEDSVLTRVFSQSVGRRHFERVHEL